MQKIYRIKTSPCARQENMIIGNQYRITVLTEGLVRLEYNADGEFEDRATQMVLYRDFPEVDYRVIHTENGIEINTSRLHLVYDEKEFSSGGLSIHVKGSVNSTWHYGEQICDLGGTARTLDGVDGEIRLDHGVVSRNGFSIHLPATPMYYWKMDGSSREKKGERIFISGDMVTIIRRLLLT